MSTMVPGIYVESKPISGTAGMFGHAYLVYRKADGTTEVIRGGPENGFEVGVSTKISVETGKPLEDSADACGENETPEGRDAVRLDISAEEAETAWRQMNAAAKQVGEAGIDYDALGWQNSNSLIRHVIEASGRDPSKSLPKGADSFDHPGLRNDLNEAVHGEAALPEQWRTPQADRPDDRTRGWPKIPPYRRDKPMTDGAKAEAASQPDEGTRRVPSAQGLGETARGLLKAIAPLEKTLQKAPADWTDGERRAVMRDAAYANPDHPDHARAQDATAGFYAALFGTDTAKTDATGRTIEPRPKRPVRAALAIPRIATRGAPSQEPENGVSGASV